LVLEPLAFQQMSFHPEQLEKVSLEQLLCYNISLVQVSVKSAFGIVVVRTNVIRTTINRTTVIRTTGIRTTGNRTTGIRIVGIRATVIRATGIRTTVIKITGIRTTVITKILLEQVPREQ